MTTSENFTKINNDVNGNPRYVCHFLQIASDYDVAVKLANKIGGRKYHTKSYGEGIVFQSYSLQIISRQDNMDKNVKVDLSELHRVY